MKIKIELKVTKWEENQLEEFNKGIPIARVSTRYETADIDGHFTVEYIMLYSQYDPKDPHNSKAFYVGFMEFYGTLNGKNGSFKMEDRGTYEDFMVKSNITIIENTGTNELINIKGSGKYYVESGKMIMELNYWG